MKNLFLRLQFLIGAILLVCINVQASDDDLITRQITIKLDEAGTLPDRIGSVRMYKITNLKIVGDINGTDLRMIRKMAGCDEEGRATEGKVSVLDLSEANIVEGGDYYYYRFSSSSYYTKNDIIGSYAFYGCSVLTNLTIPSSVTSIGESAFFGCSGLTSLTIPSSVTSIGESAFSGCSGLTNLTIPSSVKWIGWSAFYGCSGLTNLTISQGVTSIGGSAFSGCSGLTSLTIPSSITSIGRYAFSGCSGLKNVYVRWDAPISITEDVFNKVDLNTCVLHVPNGTYDDYWLSNWGIFSNIVEYDATGIEIITNPYAIYETARYSADGKLLRTPTVGLNIVKYNDGSKRKVIVR